MALVLKASPEVKCFDRRMYGPRRYWPGRGFLGPLVRAQRGEVLIRDVGGRVVRIDPQRIGQKEPKQLWKSSHLEQTYADNLEEYYELLAHHYFQSGDQEKSWDYLTKAGNRAKDQYDRKG